MRRRYLLVAVVAIVAAAALTVGIVAARGEQPPNLPQVTAAELLFKMATTDHHNLAVNGEVSWTNDLLGQSGLVDTGHYGAAQWPFMASGSGRIWIQDGNVRLESQGGGGDRVAILNSTAGKAWTYDSAANAVTEYTLPNEANGPSASPEPSPTGTFGPADIQKYIEQMAATAKVTVAGTTTVAGRDAYVLQLEPTASDTALGDVRVAVDGSTYVPLKLEVFARDAAKPTLAFGFDSISYTSVGSDLFTFTPPIGANVTHTDLAKQLKAQGGADAAKPDGQLGAGDAKKNDWQVAGHREPKPLTVDQAQSKAGFTLLTPQGYETVRPFQGAWILDKAQLAEQMKALEKANAAAGTTAGEPAPTEPAANDQTQGGQTPSIDFKKLPDQAAMFRYGEGFGSIWLVETPSNAEIDKQLAKLPEQISKEQVAGHQAWKVTTPLGGVIVWKQGDLTLMAGGMVTASDLSEFIAAVK
jgi:outer membrane lipoprotein-sorting protein